MPFLNVALRFPLPSDPREGLRADAEIRTALAEFLDALDSVDGMTFDVVYEEGEVAPQKRSYVRRNGAAPPSLPGHTDTDAA